MLNRIFISLIFFFCVGIPAARPAETISPGTTENYLIHVWQTDNGLPQNWVSSIAQTPEGYLWVGTRYGGLARFDGVRFVPFNPQNTAELKDVQVEHLSVDETGRLWVIMGNESITAFQNGRFQLFRQPRAEPRLRADHVLLVHSNQALLAGEYPYLPRLTRSAKTNRWDILDPHGVMEPDPRTFAVDRNETIWFVTQNQKLGRFQNGRFDLATSLLHLTEPVVVALATDAARQIWVATLHHLLAWNGQAFVERTPTNSSPPPEGVLQIALAGDGGLWVLEKNRLRKCLNGQWVAEANPQTFRPDMASGAFRLHSDAQGNAWLVSYGHGLWHIKTDGSTSLLTEQTGLPSEFITCWFQDSEGDVWIGTAGGGIARIRESIFHALGQAEGLSGKVVRSVCVDANGGLWAGTMSRGLAHWENGRFVEITLPPPSSDPVESVTVAPGKDGDLWIGSLNHGLMWLHAGLITRPPTPSGMGPSIRVLFTDSQGRVWVGGLVNLFCFEHGAFKQFESAAGFVGGHAIGAIAEDAKGAIWIGTGPGNLWKYDKGIFTCYTPPPEWPSVRFSALLPDTNGVIWVGTLGGGLLRFHDGQFRRYTLQDGLPDNNITQLLDGGEGNLWAGTYAGIFRVGKTDLTNFAASPSNQLSCRVYGRFDGLPALECSSGFQPACWRAGDGKLWFATANGLATVDPRDVTDNRRPPIVVIEEMLVDGKPHPLPAVSVLPAELTIGPGQHYVQFRFTGLNFAAPDGVRFRVRLEGVEGGWQDTGGQRSFGYGPLLPGDYRLRVRACNNDGVWNEEGASLSFRVLPYVWETWCFKYGLSLFIIVVLVVGAGLTLRRRYRLKLERLERLRAVERERSRIAQDLHDDLGTSLTQISMLSALANRNHTSPQESKELIQQVRSRAREMVTALDEIVWAVNPKNDSLLELINYLGHFTEEFFRPTAIRCRLDIPSFLPDKSVSAEVRHHLFLAFKEVLNNVARHSGASQILVRVEAGEQSLLVAVTDDGQGFPKTDDASRRTGNGLTNLRQRLAQMGGRAEIKTSAGQGVTVEFYLPLR